MACGNLFKFQTKFANVIQQSVRYRGKFNTARPKPRHDIARFLEEITKPVIIRQVPDQVALCVKHKDFINRKYKFDTDAAVEFERFLAKQLFKDITANDVMIILHRHYCSNELIRLSLIEFRKHEIELKTYNRIVMKLFMESNPQYQNLMPIVENGLGRNYYLFANINKLQKILDLLKHRPFFVLIGGLVQNELMTRSTIMRTVQLGDLETQHGQLCGLLNQNLASTVNLLSQPIQNIATTIEQISKNETEN